MKNYLMILVLLVSVAMHGQVTFSASEWANAQSLDNGATVTSYSQEGVTVAYAQGTGINAVVWNTSQNAIVTRQGNSMSVSAAEGQVITSASFSMKQNSHANALAGSTWSEGSATADGTNVVWSGIAQTITVNIGGTALFDSFSITAEIPEVPFVEDESTYNDTTIITPQEIADENFMGAGDEIDNLSYFKEGKQLTLSTNDYYYSMTFASDYYWPGLALRVYPGHSITISAPYRIKKIILRDAQGQNDYVWTGSTTQVEITDAYLNILDITIICDSTDSSPYTVNFYGLNGALLKTEQVPVGGSATAPVVSHECFDGWDKDFSAVHSDMDVHALLVISSEWELSEWRWNANSSLTYTQNGYTFTMAYADQRTQPYWYWDNLYLTPGDRLTITRENTFYGMKFIAGDETAAALAATQCNTGSLRRVGNDVYWYGATNALTLTIPANSDNIKLEKIGFACDYYEQVPCVVVFVDNNGQEIARETVMAGECLTNIPAGPAHEDECMEFAGWDVTDFSRIMHDLTVHPLYRAKAIISLTATEWAESQGGSVSRITKDGFTLYGDINYSSNDSSIVVRRNGGFVILNPDYFYHLTFSCSTEDYATALALHNVWSSGSVVQDGTDVIWTGETDSLLFYGSATHIVSITSLCQHFEVVFLGENDQLISTQSLTSGNPAIAPPAPVHSNECMQFAGWDHEFTHVFSNLTIRPIWNLLDDCVPEGYVRVTFMNLAGDTIETQFVLIGGSITTAPEAPAMKYHTFTGWDHALTHLTESTIIRPVYAFDTNSPDILTVVDYYNLKDTAQWRLEEDSVRAIKGLYHAKERERVADGRLTFELQWYDGNWLKSTTVYDMLNLNGEPFISHLDISEGDTVIVFGTYVNEWVEYWGGEWHREGLKDGYVAWIGAKRAEEGYTDINMPDAATLYDFSGNGLKQAVYNKDNLTMLTKDITNQFHSERMLGTASGSPTFIEDVNHDGHADVGHSWGFNSLLSSGTDYELIEGALFLPNFDANGDGRIDYMLPGTNDIMYQMADGAFRKEHIQVFTYDEYMAQFDETEWISTYSENISSYSSGSSGLVANTGWSSGMNLSGACLAQSPKRRNAGKAPSIGYTVSAVTRALDLNADGYIDLIDEKNGFLYQNMGNSKWIQFNIGRIVQPADLNNDGFTDYIFPGTQLYVMIYQGNGEFDYRNIYSNAAVDDLLYCYDFDHDGDIDILATFSTKHNATNRAYTCFFLNDGQGNFTRQTEQMYGTENLWFSACQDIDGDGYMDLLAFRGDINYTWRAEFAANTDIEIVWLQGNANKTFSDPQLLYSVAATEEGLSPEGLRINAEDLDNDGKSEIWVSGLNTGTTRLFAMADAPANGAPSAPSAPTLLYANGYLTVSWGDGADTQTGAGDLTYALRIGTTAGGNEIVAAHANADGTRRNFLDGSMSRNHTYTIDLRTYAPAMLHVAVQAIDAQHAGSAWSEEATIWHTYLPAEFELSRRTTPFNEAVEVHYTELPASYTHTWNWDGGTLNGNLLSYSTAGDKVITHTVTAPDGKAASYSVTLAVLPNGVRPDVTSDLSRYLSGGGYDYTNTSAFSDFNQDGNLDVVSDNVVYTGASPLAYTQAAGLWNTQLNGGFLWTDWNKNGSADLLLDYSTYLPHQDNAPDMSADAVTDSRLGYFSNGKYEAGYYYYTLQADLLNTGQLTVFKNESGTDMPCYFLIPNGDSYRQAEVTTDGELNPLKSALQSCAVNNYYHNIVIATDLNRDGWTDIAYVPYDDYNWVYSRMLLYENQGTGHFHQTVVPFSQTISQDDFSDAALADLNGDGYLDIIANKNNYNDQANNAAYILWNNANTSFSAPEILLSREIIHGHFADINNDGYTDIASHRPNKAAGNGTYGWYIWYMGPQGVVRHGFLNATQWSNAGWYDVLPNRLFVEDEQYVPAVYNENGYMISDERYETILREVESAAPNAAPQVPAELRAVATTEGILIEWNDAADDHTPANKMRYNLSVKHAGQSGAGAYVVSPQNGGNAQAAYLPGYQYIEANRILVSKDALTAGDYEISVQAIDQRNLMSAFSNTVTLHFDRPAIEAPTTVCTGEQAPVVYMGGESGTPTWNFNGGMVVSGTALGTQYVQWSTPGMKTITLTLNGKTHSRMIYVDSNDANVSLPGTLADGTEVTIPLPANMTAAWYIDIDGVSHTVTPRGIDGRDRQLTISDGVLTLDTQHASVTPLTNFPNIYLSVELTNANGCTQTVTQFVHIAASAKPAISMVTADASGHYVIHWDNSIAEAFSQVVVLKETNVLDQFVEVGTANAAPGSFTDRSSDGSQKAERYAIRAMSDGGVMSAVSPVHQPVHMTINRGMNDMTWNLIWSPYSGADVVSYNILRGSSENSLTQIASVSAVHTSYTDVAVEAQPYYAIEFVLRPQLSAVAAAPARIVAANTSGRSNIVNSNAARTVTYAQSMTIQSANGQYATTADKPMLLLYVEVMPTNTTYKNAIWSIISGTDLATIDPSSGLLTANTPNNGGTVTVQATAVDGSGVTATRQITIGRIESSDPATGIEETVVEEPQQEGTNSTVAPWRKILHDGQIYILCGDKVYTITGQKIR